MTGATGLLGSYIALRLQELGWITRALVRPGQNATWLQERGIEVFLGDVRDESSVAAAAKSVDGIFHCAAAIATPGGWQAFRIANVDGTRNVISAARQSGARLVHASSIAVYGSESRRPRDGVKVSEAHPFSALRDSEFYARSKRESEALVLDAQSRGLVWACVIRPDVMYGVRDRQFVPRIGNLIMGPLVPVVGSGNAPLAIVHAGNVADAAVCAATVDHADGNAYNVANDFDVSYRELLALAAAALQRKPRLVHVPESLAAIVARAVETFAISGMAARIPIPGRNSLAFLTGGNPYTSEKARRELGWVPRRRPEESIPEAFKWWRDQSGKPR